MSITGKYQLEKNENFYEHLIALGIPEERATTADRLKPVLEISMEGNKLSFSSYAREYCQKSVLVLDEVVEETIATEFHIKSIARKINDHTIEIESTGLDSERGFRRYEFTDKAMTMTIENDKENIPVARRLYTRLEQ